MLFRSLQVLLAEFEAEAQVAHGAGVPDLANALREQIEHAQEGLRSLQVAARSGREAVLALCDDALAAYAHLCQAWAWTASARACAQLLAQAPEDTQARARLERMRYGVQWLLPQAQVHWQALRAAPPLPLEVG